MVKRRGFESAQRAADSLGGEASPAAVDSCVLLILAHDSCVPRRERSRLGSPLSNISAAKSGALRTSRGPSIFCLTSEGTRVVDGRSLPAVPPGLCLLLRRRIPSVERSPTRGTSGRRSKETASASDHDCDHQQPRQRARLSLRRLQLFGHALRVQPHGASFPI